jgi:hypothetical protein
MSKTLPSLAAALAVALPVAGCGGSSPPKHATTGNPAGGIAAAAYRFAACMRAHGYPTFPNPKVSQHPGGASIAIKVVGPGPKAGPPKPCRGILPGVRNGSPQQQAARDQAQRAGLLSFASCMRRHGVDFPDPTSQGRLSLAMLAAAHIDLRAPSTLAAIKACEGASHGIVTPTVVGQALQQTSTTSGG